MCFVSGEKVRSPVHFVTFPESAVWSPSLRENSLGREVTSLIAKHRQFGGEWVVAAVVVGWRRGGDMDTWAWHCRGVWLEQLADLAGPLMLSRSTESQLLVTKF